jgi:prepilin-type N-terminal cleavage/methylation domain-containing protein
MQNEKGFTLIELLIVIAIIVILATAIMVAISESRRKARINSTLSSVRSALPIVLSCNDLVPVGHINFPAGSETGATLICQEISGSFWPKLDADYEYVPGGDYTESCNFEISTNGDRAANIICDCVKQNCQ